MAHAIGIDLSPAGLGGLGALIPAAHAAGTYLSPAGLIGLGFCPMGLVSLLFFNVGAGTSFTLRFSLKKTLDTFALQPGGRYIFAGGVSHRYSFSKAASPEGDTSIALLPQILQVIVHLMILKHL